MLLQFRYPLYILCTAQQSTITMPISGLILMQCGMDNRMLVINAFLNPQLILFQSLHLRQLSSHSR